MGDIRRQVAKLLKRTKRFKIFLLIQLLFIFPRFSDAQGFFWSEDFGTNSSGICDGGNPANGLSTANGTWTVITTGVNDAFANEWYISSSESGQAAGSCSGISCRTNVSLTDRTLHIGNVAGSPNSIACPTGDCGAYFDIGPGLVNTQKRAVSPLINCLARTDISVKFSFLHGGDINDLGTVWYSADGGGSWTLIASLPKSTPCAPGAYWTTYYASLPPSADNNPNVKIGFDWANNSDGAGTNPGFAIDNIQVGELPVPDFYMSDTSICVGQYASFFGTSTGSPLYWQWFFDHGTPDTSTLQSPPIIRFDSAGTWAIQLSVTNSVGSNTVVKYITVKSCLPPVANFISGGGTVCRTTCISFADQSANDPTSWKWFFNGGTPSQSTDKNPQNICYNTAGDFDVVLIVSNAYGADTMMQPKLVHVVDTCPRPQVNFFITDSMPVCQRSCINFFDSTTNVDPTTTWEWIFPGPDTTAFNQNPFAICYDEDGSYDVTLIVRNQYGVDTLTKTGFITVLSVPGSYISSDTTVYYGEKIQLHAGGGYSYQWQPAPTLLSPDTNAVVTVQPIATTTYSCVVSDSLGCGSYKKVTVTVLHKSNVFVPNTFAPDDATAPAANRSAFVFGNNVATIRFVIYDRWGEQLFESLDQSIGWDGTYHGKKCLPGVYIYSLQLTFNDGNTTKQNGSITLLR